MFNPRLALAPLLVGTALLAGCADNPPSVAATTSSSLAQAQPPGVSYDMPPAADTRPNTNAVPVGPEICPTVPRFGGSGPQVIAGAGCQSRY